MISVIDLSLDLLIKGMSGHKLSEMRRYTLLQEVTGSDWPNYV